MQEEEKIEDKIWDLVWLVDIVKASVWREIWLNRK